MCEVMWPKLLIVGFLSVAFMFRCSGHVIDVNSNLHGALKTKACLSTDGLVRYTLHCALGEFVLIRFSSLQFGRTYDTEFCQNDDDDFDTDNSNHCLREANATLMEHFRQCMGRQIKGHCDGNFNYIPTQPNIDQSCPAEFYGANAKAYVLVYYECRTVSSINQSMIEMVDSPTIDWKSYPEETFHFISNNYARGRHAKYKSTCHIKPEPNPSGEPISINLEVHDFNSKGQSCQQKLIVTNGLGVETESMTICSETYQKQFFTTQKGAPRKDGVLQISLEPKNVQNDDGQLWLRVKPVRYSNGTRNDRMNITCHQTLKLPPAIPQDVDMHYNITCYQEDKVSHLVLMKCRQDERVVVNVLAIHTITTLIKNDGLCANRKWGEDRCLRYASDKVKKYFRSCIYPGNCVQSIDTFSPPVSDACDHQFQGNHYLVVPYECVNDATLFLEMNDTDSSYEGTVNTFFLSTNDYAKHDNDIFPDPYNCSIKPRAKKQETFAVVIEVVDITCAYKLDIGDGVISKSYKCDSLVWDPVVLLGKNGTWDNTDVNVNLQIVFEDRNAKLRLKIRIINIQHNAIKSNVNITCQRITATTTETPAEATVLAAALEDSAPTVPIYILLGVCALLGFLILLVVVMFWRKRNKNDEKLAMEQEEDVARQQDAIARLISAGEAISEHSEPSDNSASASAVQEDLIDIKTTSLAHSRPPPRRFSIKDEGDDFVEVDEELIDMDDSNLAYSKAPPKLLKRDGEFLVEVQEEGIDTEDSNMAFSAPPRKFKQEGDMLVEVQEDTIDMEESHLAHSSAPARPLHRLGDDVSETYMKDEHQPMKDESSPVKSIETYDEASESDFQYEEDKSELSDEQSDGSHFQYEENSKSEILDEQGNSASATPASEDLIDVNTTSLAHSRPPPRRFSIKDEGDDFVEVDEELIDMDDSSLAYSRAPPKLLKRDGEFLVEVQEEGIDTEDSKMAFSAPPRKFKQEGGMLVEVQEDTIDMEESHLAHSSAPARPLHRLGDDVSKTYMKDQHQPMKDELSLVKSIETYDEASELDFQYEEEIKSELPDEQGNGSDFQYEEDKSELPDEQGNGSDFQYEEGSESDWQDEEYNEPDWLDKESITADPDTEVENLSFDVVGEEEVYTDHQAESPTAELTELDEDSINIPAEPVRKEEVKKEESLPPIDVDDDYRTQSEEEESIEPAELTTEKPTELTTEKPTELTEETAQPQAEEQAAAPLMEELPHPQPAAPLPVEPAKPPTVKHRKPWTEKRKKSLTDETLPEKYKVKLTKPSTKPVKTSTAADVEEEDPKSVEEEPTEISIAETSHQAPRRLDMKATSDEARLEDDDISLKSVAEDNISVHSAEPGTSRETPLFLLPRPTMSRAGGHPKVPPPKFRKKKGEKSQNRPVNSRNTLDEDEDDETKKPPAGAAGSHRELF